MNSRIFAPWLAIYITYKICIWVVTMFNDGAIYLVWIMNYVIYEFILRYYNTAEGKQFDWGAPFSWTTDYSNSFEVGYVHVKIRS